MVTSKTLLTNLKISLKSLNNIHLVEEKVPTMEKKRLHLVFPYLEIIPWQTRIKLQQALKGVLNCCKLEIVFKYQTRLLNSFRYKDPIPKDLISGVAYKFQKMVKVSDT